MGVNVHGLSAFAPSFSTWRNTIIDHLEFAQADAANESLRLLPWRVIESETYTTCI